MANNDDMTDQQFQEYSKAAAEIGSQVVDLTIDLITKRYPNNNDMQSGVLGQIIADMAAAYVAAEPTVVFEFAKLLHGQMAHALTHRS